MFLKIIKLTIVAMWLPVISGVAFHQLNVPNQGPLLLFATLKLTLPPTAPPQL